jgi:PhnB protein
MAITSTTHLNFRGNAREALGFYQGVFGGALAAISYKDAHSVTDPSEADQIMWGQVASPEGFAIMAYDVPKAMGWDPGQIPFFVSVGGDTGEEVTGYWEKLKDGATIVQPLAPSGWSPLYGMLKDRFGVTWVLNVRQG